MNILSDKSKSHLTALKNYAEANPISFDDLLDIRNGREPFIGDRPGHSCTIPAGFRVVFSIEYQPVKDSNEFAKTRHASFSIHDRVPHPDACKALMTELGFKKELEDCIVYYDPGEIKAINVIEIIK